jgi:hypothetical protein
VASESTRKEEWRVVREPKKREDFVVVVAVELRVEVTVSSSSPTLKPPTGYSSLVAFLPFPSPSPSERSIPSLFPFLFPTRLLDSAVVNSSASTPPRLEFAAD